MRTFATIALLGAVALAANENSSERAQEQAFMNYASKMNKTYSSVDEMNMRSDNYKKNCDKRQASRADNPRATFGDTKFSDWTEEEFLGLLGDLTTYEDRRELNDTETEGRQLQSLGDIDWVSYGVMGTVKDQGQCGSCVAFSTTAQIEGMRMLQKGESYLRLSEQQGVDCGTAFGNAGCQGGWATYYYRYYASAGVVSAADYPYNAMDNACKDISGMTKQAMPLLSTYVNLNRPANVNDMHAALQRGPATVSVYVISEWGDYTGGIMDFSTTSACNNNSSTNHSVALVGYTAGGEDVVTEVTTTTEDMYELLSCQRASKSEKRSGVCDDADRIRYSRYCCTYNFIPGTTTTTQVTESVGASWTIQNSWGTNWGDNGFASLPVRNDMPNGFCGINLNFGQIDLVTGWTVADVPV